MTSYIELLRDPRWQKKRLEIMQRDEFACQRCFDSESTLNVHHRFYKKDSAPWDYPDGSLVTLCESCHKDESAILNAEKKLLLDEMSIKGVMAAEFSELAIWIHESPPFPFPLDEFISAIGWAIGDPDMRQIIKVSHKAFIEEQTRKYLRRKVKSNG